MRRGHKRLRWGKSDRQRGRPKHLRSRIRRQHRLEAERKRGNAR